MTLDYTGDSRTELKLTNTTYKISYSQYIPPLPLPSPTNLNSGNIFQNTACVLFRVSVKLIKVLF